MYSQFRHAPEKLRDFLCGSLDKGPGPSVCARVRARYHHKALLRCENRWWELQIHYNLLALGVFKHTLYTLCALKPWSGVMTER